MDRQAQITILGSNRGQSNRGQSNRGQAQFPRTLLESQCSVVESFRLGRVTCISPIAPCPRSPLIGVQHVKSYANAPPTHSRTSNAEYAAHAAAPRSSSTPGISIHLPEEDDSNASVSVRRKSAPHSGQSLSEEPRPRRSYSQSAQTSMNRVATQARIQTNPLVAAAAAEIAAHAM